MRNMSSHGALEEQCCQNGSHSILSVPGSQWFLLMGGNIYPLPLGKGASYS